MENDLVPPGLTYLADNIRSHQNILGASKEQSARWAKDLGLPERADTVFFAGCGYQYSAQLEKLMSLSRSVDKSVIGSELPMRFATMTDFAYSVTLVSTPCFFAVFPKKLFTEAFSSEPEPRTKGKVQFYE